MLRFHGVGNASAVELGSAMATLEREGVPWLTIDCGGEGLTAFQARYGDMPRAVFITHVHLDHVAGMERLFVASYFDPARRGQVRLYVPAPLVPVLHQRIAGQQKRIARGFAQHFERFEAVALGDGEAGGFGAAQGGEVGEGVDVFGDVFA